MCINLSIFGLPKPDSALGKFNDTIREIGQRRFFVIRFALSTLGVLATAVASAAMTALNLIKLTALLLTYPISSYSRKALAPTRVQLHSYATCFARSIVLLLPIGCIALFVVVLMKYKNPQFLEQFKKAGQNPPPKFLLGLNIAIYTIMLHESVKLMAPSSLILTMDDIKKGTKHIQELLEHSPSLANRFDTKSFGTIGPLYEVICRKDLEMLKCFCETGYANLELADSTGYTPILLAALLKEYSSVLYLAEKGADLKKKTNAGLTLEFLLRSDPNTLKKINDISLRKELFQYFGFSQKPTREEFRARCETMSARLTGANLHIFETNKTKMESLFPELCVQREELFAYFGFPEKPTPRQFRAKCREMSKIHSDPQAKEKFGQYKAKMETLYPDLGAPISSQDDLFDYFELDRRPTRAEYRLKWRELALATHPDKEGNDAAFVELTANKEKIEALFPDLK